MPVEGAQYPVNLILTGKRCLVVGGGPIAARKVAGLLACGADVHVVAPAVSPELAALPVAVEQRPYREEDLAGNRLVIAATNDAALNRTIYQQAEQQSIWVNSADDPASCTFTLPSIIRRGPVMVTVSTGGRSPALATWLKRRLEEEVGSEYEVLVDLLSTTREDMRAAGRSTEQADWQSVLDSDMLELIKAGHTSVAKERLKSWLSSSSD
ncbi:MAG TPA: bifunctional precorrin-2 dehydrogenase/sirohydrochlorin ferrochelatase [Acidimicrobiales bacterium]|jgi:siroheme synthase-like protein|nr:bifunctional precorrin-2 dehydrogenase/sirohydrochlorin ferrochelatase [Acidimicrobiales bacterium]